jgi:hypothetical protein
MQAAIRAGVHRSDEGRLLACLRDNAEALRACGTNVPEPESYHRKLRDLIQTAQQTALPPDTRAAMAEVTGTDEHTARLVLDNPGFFDTPKMAVGESRFYPAAEIRLALFPADLRAMAGIDETVPLRGEFTLPPEIPTETGLARVTAFVESRGGLGDAPQERMVADFLDNFADPDAVEEESDVPD